MFSPSYLIVEGHTKPRVRLATTKFSGEVPSGRISPIFPLSKDANPKRFGDAGEFGLYFVYSKAPAIALGRLIQALNSVTIADDYLATDEVWYSNGLANILLFHPQISRDSADKIENCLQSTEGLVGWEHWTVADGIRTDWYTNIPDDSCLPLEVNSYDDLPATFVHGLDEAVSALSSLVRKVQIYTPHNRHIYLSLVDEINSLIKDIRANSKLKDANAQVELLDKHDTLVQIYAALSYVSSQCFSGISPILEHPGQIRPHSLLGVGSSLLGVQALVAFIHQSFWKSQLYDLSYDPFPEMKPLGTFAQPNSGFQPIFDPNKALDKALLQYKFDNYGLGRDVVDTPPSTMVHFSARRGFQQTSWCITLPTQCIFQGSTKDWSIQTITHEQMHAFQDTLVNGYMYQSLSRATALYVKDRLDYMPNIDGFWEYLDELYNENIDSSGISRNCAFYLQLLICLRRLEYASTSYQHIDGELEQRKRLHPKNLFKAYDHDLREWMVHTLDINYFYSQDEFEYVDTIWHTWSTVPQVFERFREYLLRTILAMATLVHGHPEDRFAEVCKKLIAYIKQTYLDAVAQIKGRKSSKSSESNTFLYLMSAIAQMLSDQSEYASLKVDFLFRIPICDLTRSLLVSESLAGKLQRDTTIDDTNKPSIEPGHFDLRAIESPIAFVRTIPKAKLLVDSHVSCWMYLHLMTHSFANEGAI